jgi:23S rRNA G2069 N7-methylase RlmK/C1962 C5-methylase RlmI
VPPTWIGAKAQGREGFELARDATALTERSLRLGAAGGELVFFCRERGVKVDTAALSGLAAEVRDISCEVTDKDFERSRIASVAISLRP